MKTIMMMIFGLLMIFVSTVKADLIDYYDFNDGKIRFGETSEWHGSRIVPVWSTESLDDAVVGVDHAMNLFPHFGNKLVWAITQDNKRYILGELGRSGFGWVHEEFAVPDDIGSFQVMIQGRWYKSTLYDVMTLTGIPHEASPVPEPCTLLMLGAGLLALGGFKQKVKRA